MSATPSAFGALVAKAIDWSIAVCVLLIIAVLFAICVPLISGVGVTLLFGWLMMLSGITHFIFAFKTHTTGSLIWELIIGAIYLFTGVYLILHPIDALFVLTLILACYLFFEAIVEFIQFFQLRPRHGARWLLVDGVITLILAIMIWRS